MIANTLSPCFATEKVAESRDFYVKHFGAKVINCGRRLVTISLFSGMKTRILG